MYDSEIHHRRSIRLRGYNYATSGYYFVTVCVQYKKPLLGEIADNEMLLNDAGRMVADVWRQLPQRYPNVALDEYAVMPNHFHGIIIIDAVDVGAGPRACPCTGYQSQVGQKGHPQGDGQKQGHPQGGAPTVNKMSLSDIVHRFKSLSTNRYIHGVKKNNWPPFPGKLWQRNYYERIIRTETELNNIRQYIRDNPCKWTDDPENPIKPQP